SILNMPPPPRSTLFPYTTLFRSGVGRLVLNDFDRVDATNLPRQILYGPADVGRPKAEVAAERLRAANPDVRVEALDRRLDAAGLDRKSTRLNSSHVKISYAVFCL